MNLITRLVFVFSCLLLLCGVTHATERFEKEHVNKILYTIVWGDNLTKIAKQFRLQDYNEVAKINAIKNPNRIYAGANLWIPRSEQAVVAAPAIARPELTEREILANDLRDRDCSKTRYPDEVGSAVVYSVVGNIVTTSSRETYNPKSNTIAHPTLPFGTYVCIWNEDNEKSVVARVNNRGPFVGKHIIAVSQRIAETLEMLPRGVARVNVTVLDPSSRWRRPEFARAAVSMRKALVATHVGNVATKRATRSVSLERVARIETTNTGAMPISSNDWVSSLSSADLEEIGSLRAELATIVGSHEGTIPLAVLIFLKRHQGGPLGIE